MKAATAATLLVCLTLALAAPEARGQTCTEPPRVPYAGHNFPLDTPPAQQAMTPVAAFPNLPTLTQPTFLTYAPDGSNRIFVLERAGTIRVFDNDPNASSFSTFLDLSAIVDSQTFGEMGLLGLAFDPNFPTNHYFYLNYTQSGTPCAAGTGICTKIMRYSVPAATPNTADPNSGFELLEYAQPDVNHKGGMLAFTPDGYLWIAAGDGGGAGDPSGNGQNTQVLLGKLLRIDPSGDDFPADPKRNYRIPKSNPYASGTGGAPEVWAYGLRNPWRFSFDRGTGDLYIGDVGQDLYEEVDYEPAAALVPPTRPAGGYNFGWNICEGFHDYAGNCAASNTTKPVIEYAHTPPSGQTGGSTVIGGYVYRGSSLPGLFGAYVYGDYIDGNIWTWNGTLPAQPVLVATMSVNPTSFGEDRDGELYITGYDGHIYKLQFNTTPPAPFPANLSGTGLFANTATLTPAPGLVEYDVNAPLWSDGATKRRWVALPAGTKVHFQADGAFDFPVGTALVKHFEIQTSPTTTRRLETRVFLRQVDRWTGFTYKWNTAQTDATLLSDSATDTITITSGGTQHNQTWNYPSPAQCLVCHSTPEKHVLGPRVLQLNKSFSYPSGADNQIHAWQCMGMFDQNPQGPLAYGAYANIADTTKSVQLRTRAYLASNCSMCHQPLGPAPGSMDFRYTRLLGEMNAIGVAPTEGNLGLTNPLRIQVGVPAQSIVYVRQQSTDPTVRMPLNSQVADPNAVPVFSTWIGTTLAASIDSDQDGVPDSTDNCPRVANANQADSGGFGTTSADGIGSACQCGDVNGDGKVDASDITTLRKALTKVPPLSGNANRRCESPAADGECSVVSWARIAKGLSGAAAAHGQTCAAATELGP